MSGHVRFVRCPAPFTVMPMCSVSSKSDRGPVKALAKRFILDIGSLAFTVREEPAPAIARGWPFQRRQRAPESRQGPQTPCCWMARTNASSALAVLPLRFEPSALGHDRVGVAQAPERR